MTERSQYCTFDLSTRGCRERSIAEPGLLTQVVGMGTRGKKRGIPGEDRIVPARSYGPM